MLTITLDLTVKNSYIRAEAESVHFVTKLTGHQWSEAKETQREEFQFENCTWNDSILVLYSMTYYCWTGLTITSIFIHFQTMKVYHISVKRPSNYSYSWSSTLSAPSTICTCPSTYFTTCLWTNFHDSVFIIFQIINSISTIVAKYALVLLVLWRLRVEAGRHRNPSVGSHLRCRFVTLISFVFDPHHIFSVIFNHFFWEMDYLSLFEEPPRREYKNKQE